jgi:hypothetical protein
MSLNDLSLDLFFEHSVPPPEAEHLCIRATLGYSIRRIFLSALSFLLDVTQIHEYNMWVLDLLHDILKVL